MPKGVKEIEVFLVGGGGAGGTGYLASSSHQVVTKPWENPNPIYVRVYTLSSGGGGGGGYTRTEKLATSSGEEIAVSIGSLKGNTVIGSLIANKGGDGDEYDHFNVQMQQSHYGFGGSGGSGGGGGTGSNAGTGIEVRSPYTFNAASGGKDGSNGSSGGKWYNSSANEYYTVSGGAGQGTTTRAFAEQDGTLYASGGCGGTSGTLTTGAGMEHGQNGNPETNGQGIAIIRWGY